MGKLTTRLITALLTFAVGITATAIWYLRRQPANQEVRLSIPNASWEPIFFRDINAVANLSGQADLRKTGLAGGDVEVRVWWGFGLSPLEGVTIRHIAGQWSAIHVKADNYYEPKKAERRELRPPKSGWAAVWRRLIEAGILWLPDASEVSCGEGGLDGIAFAIETNTNKTYRTYKYSNPMLAQCSEAKRVMEISDIIHEEFGLEEFSGGE